MKRYLIPLLIAAGSLTFLYFGINGMIALTQVFYERYQVTQYGIITEGEFSEYIERGSARSRYQAVTYKFFVEGFENKKRENQMKELLGEDGYQILKESEESMRKANELLGIEEPEKTNGSWVYGEDFRSFSDKKFDRGDKFLVTYLPSDPNMNMAGDRRNSSVWGLFRSDWLLILMSILSSAFGVYLGGFFIYAIIRGLIKNTSNQSVVTTPEAAPPAS